ncbi:hypothetical protein QBC41DRAFT_257974, partial [Cercophora samala]
VVVARGLLWGWVGWANWARFGLEIKNTGYRNRREQRHFQRGYEGQRGFWGGKVEEEEVEDKDYDYRKELRESRVYAGRREYEGGRRSAREYESRRDYESRREHRERKEHEDRRE